MNKGDKVTFYFWHDGALVPLVATIVAVRELEVGETSPRLDLDVDFSEEMLAGGVVREQPHVRQRTHAGDDVSASGSWSLLS